MDFLLDFYEFNTLEHRYDSVVNKQLGLPSKSQSPDQLIDYIKQMIDENQVDDIIRKDDSISFKIRNRQYEINKSGILSLYKVQSSYEEIKNIDVLRWIFGNELEAMDALKVNPKWMGRIRTIDAQDIIELRELNKKIGKRNQEDFDKNFRTPKKYSRKNTKVDVHIDKNTSLYIYDKLSSE